MKKIIISLLFIGALKANSQIVSFTYDGDTLKAVNPLTGEKKPLLSSSPYAFSIGTVANTAPLTVTNFRTIFPTPQSGTLLHLVSDAATNGRISFDTYQNTSSVGSNYQGRRARGTAAAPTAAIANDIMLALGSDGYGSTGFHNISLASITMRSEGTMTDTDAPTYMTFSTTPTGTVTNTERMRIKSTGVVQIFNLNAAGVVQTDASGNLSTGNVPQANVTNLVSDLAAKQATLVSGTNIKTINGSSVLGSGDITVGGSAAWGGITGTLSSQTDLQNALNAKQNSLGFTPYNATNPNGYISSVPAQSFASLTGKPTTLSGYGITDAANISHTHTIENITDLPVIPTNTNQLTNGSGFITTETDPIVKAVNGLVKSNGTTIAAAVSGTDIKTINGTSLLGSGDIAIGTPTYINLASAFSSTIVTEAAVTGWNFPVTANKAYKIDVIGLYQTAATTTGGELGFFLTASGAGTIAGNVHGAIVSTAAATSLNQQVSAIGAADLAGSNMITTGVTAINSPHFIKASLIFRCTVSGTFNVGWASEVAASAAQLNAGSALIYQQLN